VPRRKKTLPPRQSTKSQSQTRSPPVLRVSWMGLHSFNHPNGTQPETVEVIVEPFVDLEDIKKRGVAGRWRGPRGMIRTTTEARVLRALAVVHEEVSKAINPTVERIVFDFPKKNKEAFRQALHERWTRLEKARQAARQLKAK
jgi:hypothetical protein